MTIHVYLREEVPGNEGEPNRTLHLERNFDSELIAYAHPNFLKDEVLMMVDEMSVRLSGNSPEGSASGEFPEAEEEVV